MIFYDEDGLARSTRTGKVAAECMEPGCKNIATTFLEGVVQLEHSVTGELTPHPIRALMCSTHIESIREKACLTPGEPWRAGSL